MTLFHLGTFQSVTSPPKCENKNFSLTLILAPSVHNEYMCMNVCVQSVCIDFYYLSLLIHIYLYICMNMYKQIQKYR